MKHKTKSNEKKELIALIERMTTKCGPVPAGKSVRKEISPNLWLIYIGMEKDGKLACYRADIAWYMPESYSDDDSSFTDSVLPERHGSTRRHISYTAQTTAELIENIQADI